jgi:hypothetical protein
MGIAAARRAGFRAVYGAAPPRCYARAALDRALAPRAWFRRRDGN